MGVKDDKLHTRARTGGGSVQAQQSLSDEDQRLIEQLKRQANAPASIKLGVRITDFRPDGSIHLFFPETHSYLSLTPREAVDRLEFNAPATEVESESG